MYNLYHPFDPVGYRWDHIMRYHKVSAISGVGMLLGWTRAVTQTTLQLLLSTRLHGASSIRCRLAAFG